MALQARTLHIPAGRPIDMRTQPEHLEAGAFNLRVENMRQDKRGGLIKRPGSTPLSSTRLDASTRSVGHKMFAYGDQVCVIDGHLLDAYSSQGGFNITKDRVPEPSHRRIPVPNQGRTPGLASSFYVNGYIVIGTVSSTTVLISVLDATTYAVIRQDVFAGSGLSLFTLGAVGNVAFLVYQSAANTLTARVLTTTTRANLNTGWSAGTSVATDFIGNQIIASVSLEDRFAIAYGNNSGGTDELTVKTLSTTPAVLETLTVNTSSTTPDSYALAGSNADTLWIAWSEGTAIRALGVTGNALATPKATVATVTSVSAATVTSMGVAVTGTGAARLYGNSSSSTTSFQFVVRSWTTAAGAVTPGAAAISYYWITAGMPPFVVDGRIYVGAIQRFGGSNENEDRIFVVFDMTDDSVTLRPVANIGPGTSIGSFGTNARLSSTKVALLNGFQTRGTTTYVDGAGVELVVMDFGSRERWQPTALGNGIVLSGGATTFFDGNMVSELGFLFRPNKPTEDHSGGTTLSATVGYRYVAIYEQTDSNGNIHVSGVSDPSTSTGAFTTQDVVVTVNNLFVTSRYDTSNTTNPIRIGLYRTTDGGVIFYRVTTLTNSTSAATQNYTDVMLDADLITKAKLYRQPLVPGGNLDRRAPPGTLGMTICNDTLVALADDGVSLWPFGQPVYGEGAWCSPALQAPVPDGGQAYAIASMDGLVFLFKRRGILAIPCEIPNDAGTAGGIGQPRRLACDVGAISPHTVVTSLGVFFMSERGIELLTRGQTVDFVGEAVKPVTDDYGILTAATLVADQGLVYFDLANVDTGGLALDTGRTLVFDITLKAWVSVDIRRGGSLGAQTPAQSAAMVYSGLDGETYRYAWLSTDGVVHVESEGARDAGTYWPTALWETPRVRMGLQQQMRLWEASLLVGSSYEPTGLQVELCYDTATYQGGTDTKAWTEAAAATERRFPLRPKSERFAVGFRVSDVQPVEISRGFTHIGISCDIAPKQGSTKGTPHGDVTMRR